MGCRLSKRGQQWSLEVILAVSVFIVVFILSLSLLRIEPPEVRKTLELDSVRLYEEAQAQNGFIDGGSFDYIEFTNWYNRTKSEAGYAELKNELGVSSDFCIFIEDNEGNIFKYQTIDNESFYGVGGGNLMIRTSTSETIPCGTQIN